MKLTNINISHFKQLTSDREDSLRLLNKASMKGIRDSVVERYSEQAHFVYELLQNADDVKATRVQFKLRKEGLYFIHNGKIPFSITPPNVTPAGHINAITSIGASSKKTETFKIGKFGIGFKSVFQYTQTPYIYDENIAFRIRDLIVPELLEEQQHPLRKTGETLFYFPFNHEQKLATEAKKEIQHRLEELPFPLLFLNHLLKIDWETEETVGFYHKKILPNHYLGVSKNNGQNQALNQVQYSYLNCQKKIGKKIRNDHFFQLSKKESNSQLPYSIVFLMRENAKRTNKSIIAQQNFPAYCFFPTRVQSPLRFLIHAPFLLTDSREGIKLENDWNQQLIHQLAKLPIEALPILKREGLLNEAFFQSMPFSETPFLNREKHFFYPFYEEWFTFLKTTDLAILPIDNAEEAKLSKEEDLNNQTQNSRIKHSSVANAFLADSQTLRQLLPPLQLAALSQNPKAVWVFSNLSLSNGLGVFIRQVLVESAHLNNRPQPILSWEVVLKWLNVDFLNQQSDHWLIFLYEQLLFHHRSLWHDSKGLALQKPIIRLENGEMVRAFHPTTGQPNAFLPTHLKTDYPTVKKSIVEHPNARTFLENLGLQTPELRAELEKFILPKYRKKQTVKLPKTEDLEKLFLHYQNCNAEEAAIFVEQLRELPFLKAVKNEQIEVAARPTEVYFRTKTLKKYFGKRSWLSILHIDDILKQCSQNIDKQKLIAFLEKTGVARFPRFLPIEDSLSFEEKEALMQIQTPGASYAMWEEVIDFSLEGLASFLQKIAPERSLFLWNLLLKLWEQVEIPSTGIYRYEYEDKHIIEFEPQWIRLLKKTAWLQDQNGNFHSPLRLSFEQLHPQYKLPIGHPLKTVLFSNKEQNRFEALTADERTALELGQRLLQQGLRIEDWQQFQQWQERRSHKTSKKKKKKKNTQAEPKDADEFNPAFMSSDELLAKQEELRQKLESELQEKIEELMQIERLKTSIKEAEPYSFLWFKSLLELEYILAFEQLDKDKHLRIEFGKVELEEGTSKIIFLKKPVRYIPSTIEAMGDMSLKIQLETERKTLAVEVVSIKEFSLRAKLKTPEEVVGIDFKKVRGAVLDIQNTIFTLEELLRAFEKLPFENQDNLKLLLPQKLRFIFGPPGTGKTTYLASEEILPSMLGEQALKILVLTPTNKSADVLARKLLSLTIEAPEWLFRFGNSGDSVVENAGLLCDNTLKIAAFERYCVITTATRFPYDGFHYGQAEYQLKNLAWDLIIVDEASMISLPMITYILHKQSQSEFVIAGDPFQIEPIVYAEEWKGQNLYTMVNLQSFDPIEQQKNIIPHPYSILNLTTQYRSIPSLGKIFSHFAYGGKLQHHRKADNQRHLFIRHLPLKAVSVIYFPTHKLETLYRSQRLSGSHYHVYSALLLAEIVKYMVEQIYDNHIEGEIEAQPWRIGIICPYRAQAMLVDKIISGQNIFRPKVQVNCGTIHSFQGDECDIMFNLFNPPYSISRSPQMFLNRRNILNVAVSRAKDYLILLLPDKLTEGVENLYQINFLKSILSHHLVDKVYHWNSAEIEEILFQQLDYLEQNTFATTHQSINVYTEPEKRFEIRVEDMAVDVQIKEEKATDDSHKDSV